MEHKTLPQRVKEVTDFVYEYLAPHNDFVQMSARGILGSNGAMILSNLVKRGIVEKKLLPNKKGCVYGYKWVATMAPTKTLYGSIADQLRDDDKRRREAKKTTTSAAPVAVDPEMEVVNEMFEKVTYHHNFSAVSDQELWDELKRRGYFIVNNQLAISRLEYLK